MHIYAFYFLLRDKLFDPEAGASTMALVYPDWFCIRINQGLFIGKVVTKTLKDLKKYNPVKTLPKNLEKIELCTI